MGNKRKNLQYCGLALLGFLVAALPAAAKPPLADVQIGPTAATFTPQALYGALQLRVAGPRGFVHQETVDGKGGGAVVFHYADPSGAALPDGQYAYELRLNPARQTKVREGSELSAWKPAGEVLSGTFTIQGGVAVDPGQREQPLTKDQVIPDDLIVDGSLCVGFDCINNENFGFDTIRLKENNLRIKFEDTSAGTFPSTDWQLTANDSASGGANKFSIEDITSARVPFTITGGAPTNSLFVDSSGRMGLGTSTPVLNLHVTSGNTPALRLEQNGSSGFTAQTWDIAGNEASFFIRDVTGGSTLPFRIRPGAPSSSIDIAADGDVGIGTASPDAKLHVIGSAKFASADDGTAPAEVFEIQTAVDNSARLRFDDGNNWNIGGGAGNTFVIFDPSDAAEFQINGAGDVTITGGLITTGGGGACTALDPCDGVFHPDFALPTIEEHAAFMWENSYLPAVGPTPEGGPINVTQKVGGILNELEKAHIYIEQLNNVNRQQQQVIDDLQRRLARLEGSSD